MAPIGALRRLLGAKPKAAQAPPMSPSMEGTPGRQSSPERVTPQVTGSSGEIDFEITREDASIETRKAGFAHLKALATQPASSDKRQAYFETIIIPVDLSISDLQIDALDSLTSNGKNVDPFQSEMVNFLNKMLEQLFASVEKGREDRKSGDPGTNVWALQYPHTASSSPNAPSQRKSFGRDGSSPVKDPLGINKALLDTFYLFASMINHNPQAFRDAQLASTLAITNHIAKRSTMRRTLRGSLKILSSITGRLSLHEIDVRPTVLTLCATLGNPDFKFRDEAWSSISALLHSDSFQPVLNVLILVLSADLDATENRNVAEYRGALIAFGNLAKNQTMSAASKIDLESVLIGLIKAYETHSHIALDILQTFSHIMSSGFICEELAASDWGFVGRKLDMMDNTNGSPFQSQNVLEFAGLRANIGSASPFSGFVGGDFTKHTSRDADLDLVFVSIGERIIFLLDHTWQFLSKDKLNLVFRILLYLNQREPALIARVVQKMRDCQYFASEDADALSHLEMAVHLVSKPQRALDAARCLILKSLQDLWQSVRLSASMKQRYEEIVILFCDNTKLDIDVSATVTASLAELVALVGPYLTPKGFEIILQCVESSFGPSRNEKATTETLQIFAECLVNLFVGCYRHSYSKTNRIYLLMLKTLELCPATAIRLHLMKLLVRLRCNSDFAITIGNLAPVEEILSNLCAFRHVKPARDLAQSSSNRPSLHGHAEAPRTGRSSAIDFAATPRSRSATRSLNARDRRYVLMPPTWMQEESLQELPQGAFAGASLVTSAQQNEEDDSNILDMGQWLDFMRGVLAGNRDWELYTYVLVHMPLQLTNCSLFSNQVKALQILHSTIVMQLTSAEFHEPPVESGIKKGDVALCLYQILISLLPYQESFSRRMTDDTIRSFRLGIEKWDRTSKTCIHALALCCHEVPFNIERQIFGIAETMQKRVTQADLAMDILEFLVCLVRARDAYGNADGTFYRRIFGICIRCLQHTWEQRQKPQDASSYRASVHANRKSGSFAELQRAGELNPSEDAHGVSEYVVTLAYQTIIFWFLAINVRERAQHVGWLTQELAWKDESGEERMQEQSLVILDMMHRTTFSDLGESEPAPEFLDSKASVIKKMWLVGMSIVTIELLTSSDVTQRTRAQVTKRQASGTTHANYYHNTMELPAHHVTEDDNYQRSHNLDPLEVYLNHVFLQITSTIAPTPTPLQPIPLPEDEFTKRAVKVFDAIDTVDGHKAGVIFVGRGQSSESEILANSLGTDAYDTFVSGLGTKVVLKGARFNPQGLDRKIDEDGSHTYAWRDRVTEIVFHVATMMPTDLHEDPNCDKKKRHIGNDHVKIVFNASGLPFNVETFSSAMNTVNILITPEAHTREGVVEVDRTLKRPSKGASQSISLTDRFGHYVVQTFFPSEYPEISFAAEKKVVSADALPAFVRQMAINASVFCQVWPMRDGQYISSWRARLQEITRLRKRYANTNVSANVHYPMTSDDETAPFAEGDVWTAKITTGGMADPEKLLKSMDFTRWT